MTSYSHWGPAEAFGLDRGAVEIAVLREALKIAAAQRCRCPKPLPPGCYGTEAEPKEWR